MPFSGPFDLSLGGYTVTPGQGSPGSPAPVDLGAYTVFPGGGRVGAPGLGFGPSTAAYNPGSGFFEGAVSGSPESITGAISGPGTPNLTGSSSAPGQASAPGVGSGSPNGITVSPTRSGFLGMINALSETSPAAQLGGKIGLSPTMSNLGLSVIGQALGPVGALLSGINTIGSIVGPKAKFNDPQGLQKLVARFNTFAAGADVSGGPGISGPVGPGSASGGVPGIADNDPSNASVSPSSVGAVGIPDSGAAGPVGPGSVSGGVPGAGDNSGSDDSAGVGPTGPGSSSDGVPGSADNASDAGGGGGGGVGDKIICAELYRQGLMDEATYRADEAFGEYLRKYDPVALAGYHRWARPVVAVMRRSRWATRGVWLVAKPWAQEMAGRPNLVGTVLMAVGLPFCRLLGRGVIRRAGDAVGR